MIGTRPGQWNSANGHTVSVSAAVARPATRRRGSVQGPATVFYVFWAARCFDWVTIRNADSPALRGHCLGGPSRTAARSLVAAIFRCRSGPPAPITSQWSDAWTRAGSFPRYSRQRSHAPHGHRSAWELGTGMRGEIPTDSGWKVAHGGFRRLPCPRGHFQLRATRIAPCPRCAQVRFSIQNGEEGVLLLSFITKNSFIPRIILHPHLPLAYTPPHARSSRPRRECVRPWQPMAHASPARRSPSRCH